MAESQHPLRRLTLSNRTFATEIHASLMEEVSIPVYLFVSLGIR